MITGLYSAIADSIPILCITGQAPRARLYKEDFQAVDIESISKPVTKWSVTVREPAQVPRAFQQAFHLMRSGRPGPVLIDLPFDVQMTEIEFDIDTYEPLPVYKPHATRKQIEKAIGMLQAAERPLIVAGGGIINADASDLLQEFAELTNTPVIPTLMGWGTIPDDHPLMAGMCGLQTSHRYGNATMRRVGSAARTPRAAEAVHPSGPAWPQLIHWRGPNTLRNCAPAIWLSPIVET
jgi:tartronate-semialdehyde synthase